MAFNYLTLFTALAISAVAIFYSISGLVAIFPAIAVSIIVMGTVLEIAKLVVAVWLHKHWKTAKLRYKIYLPVAVLALMMMTSMGIFGFLSKGHVEQTAQSEEQVAKVERLKVEIARQNTILKRARDRIAQIESNTGGVDGSIQAQIDREQERINTAYDRVQPQIDAQLATIAAEDKAAESRVAPYAAQIKNIDTVLTDLQAAINNGNIAKAQGIVGTKIDGNYGPKTAQKVEAFRKAEEAKRQTLLTKMQSIRGEDSLAKKEAQAEIKRIRDTVQAEIDGSNALIARLRDKLGNNSAEDIESALAKENAKVIAANEQLDKLLAEKAAAEVSFRKLEAEVGPIKYIAAFVYDREPDAALLERAVTWLIILIIFVFDPLAVILLIAAQYGFEEAYRTKNGDRRSPVQSLKDIIHECDDACQAVEESFNNTKEEINEAFDEVETKFDSDLESIISQIETVHQEKPEKIIEKPEWEEDPEILPSDTQQVKSINLMKIAEDYVSFNGKQYRLDALKAEHPELELDFASEVEHGIGFSNFAVPGKLFLRIDQQPTKLYRFNGEHWDQIDKNLLLSTAYSKAYIKDLIEEIGQNRYNPELLNALERQRIEQFLEE